MSSTEWEKCAALDPGWSSGVRMWPQFIAKFVLSYLQDHPPRSVLDVTADVDGLLPALVQRFYPEKAVAISKKSQTDEVGLMVLQQLPNVEWITGNAVEALEKQAGGFDLVVGMPPWGAAPLRVTLQGEKSAVVLNDDAGTLLMLRALQVLGSEGAGFFVMPPSFLLRRKPHSVRSHLHDFGIQIHAAIALPAGTFAPPTTIGGLLIIARRRSTDKLFVAELGSDDTWQKALEANLKSRRPGRVPQLGALVDFDSFTSFDRFVTETEIASLGRKLGIPAVPLGEIATEFNQVKSGANFTEKANSLYIPTIGRSSAVASLSALKIKPHNYLQVVIDPTQALASHVADFFNSRLGLLIRASLESGSFIQHLTKGALPDARVYLPSLEAQGEAIRVRTAISEITTQLESFRRDLSENPRRAKEIEKSLKSLGRKETLDDWVESLPFPLASILRFYLAELEPERKCQHLLHFFEALSEFTATLILSAFASDPSFYSEKCEAWLDKDERFKNAFRVPTFGSWNVLGLRLAKTIRRMLSDPMDRKKCTDLFDADESFVATISEKDVFGILEEVKTYRNEWMGHGGLANDQEWLKRSTLLQEKLADIRILIKDVYSDVFFVLPETSKYDEGIYYYTVRLLRGSGQIFSKMQLETLVPMSSGQVYMQYSGHLKPVKILPFVRIMESPAAEQNACYFYNRFENGKARYVSYHFKPQGEIDRTDHGIESALSLLMPQTSSPVTK